MDKLLKRTLNEKIRTQRYSSRSYYSLLAEKESIRLTARTGEFTRIVERATESSAAQPSCAINVCLIAQNLSSRRKRGQLLLCNKHLFCSAGFLPILVILRATRHCFLYSQ